MTGTFFSLVPPIVAIALALITKEVYSSLFIGILIGGAFFAIDAGSGFTGFFTHVFSDGMIKQLSSSWNVGIQEPFADHSSYIGYSVISDLSAVTTGIYERCFEEDGVLYHHILDPRTGYPFGNGLVSVTVFGPEAAFCDALSTACFTQGPADGAALVESFGGPAGAGLPPHLRPAGEHLALL